MKKTSHKMVKTLYAKLALVLFVLLFIIVVLYQLLTYYTTGMYLNEVNQRLHEDLSKNLVAEKILMIDGEINETALKEVFHTLMVINPSIEVYLLDPKGKILSYSAPPEKVKREKVSLEPVAGFLNKEKPFPIMGDDPRATDRKKVFSAYPIQRAGSKEIDGYLYIILGGEEYESIMGMLKGSYIMRHGAWTAVGVTLIALIAGLLLFSLLTKRLRRLTLDMDRFKENSFAVPHERSLREKGRAGGTGADEIDRLAEAFYDMSDRIVKQLEELKRTDNLRRELIANVSHDLRTPLASLQGYLETLLIKEGQLSVEEQKEYLETAARHSERLGKLVTELFELSKLNSRETVPNREPFSLGELVQDVCQKFQLSAEEKKVKILTDFPEDLSFVNGDIGLIERVFENLLDNALRYTPAGGTIKVALGRSDNNVSAQVSDTGTGISEEELPYIFDRYYRAHGSDTGGAGLGLAIANRIVKLHLSALEVESSPNKGTSFKFYLPLYNS
jgi:signal transduction histidine kinase